MSQAFNQVSIKGTFVSGAEVWSVNPKFIQADGGTIEDYQQLENWAIGISQLNSGNVFPPALRGLLSTAGSITEVTCSYYGANGHLAEIAAASVSPAAPGTGSATKPLQTALVSSLRTGRPGRSYRGRIYWPALNASISSSSLRMTATDCGNILTAIVGFLNELEASAQLTTPPSLAVISQTASTYSLVNQVLVGDVLDTQRRRRDSFPETYYESDF